MAKGAYLIVELPPELSIGDKNKLTRGCHRYQEGYYQGFPYQYIQCRYDARNNRVRIDGGFQTNASAADPPTLQFVIPGFTNPRMIMSTGMFNITIYDYTTKVLYYFNQTRGPFVSMLSYRAPNSINYTRSTYENGQQANYTWRIVASNYLTEDDIFIFTLPSPIVFSPNTTMWGQSYWLKGK